jgi:OmpA-OmpF porin, OOP family
MGRNVLNILTEPREGANVAAARLKPFGAGPYSPAASNDTEEGRAKNRRIELVKQ